MFLFSSSSSCFSFVLDLLFVFHYKMKNCTFFTTSLDLLEMLSCAEFNHGKENQRKQNTPIMSSKVFIDVNEEQKDRHLKKNGN